MTTYIRQGRGVICGLLLALALPATALAADPPPTVSTSRATDIGQDVATLHGAINPRGNPSTGFFQYGTSRLYGSTTPDASIGAGKSGVKTSAIVGGLAPYTRYHYRLVARYGDSGKLRFGDDRTFKTKRQPLGLTLVGAPTRVRAGGDTILTGVLSGTGAEGQQVLLQTMAYPSMTFVNTGNPQVVQAGGGFTFPVLDVFVNTTYRVLLPEKPEVVSPIVQVTVPVRVRLRVKRRVRRGHRVTFRGRVTPTNGGAPVEIQRNFHGVWVAVKRTTLRDSGAGSSFYRTRLRVRRSGRYRALVTPGPAYVSDTSRVHRIRVRR